MTFPVLEIFGKLFQNYLSINNLLFKNNLSIRKLPRLNAYQSFVAKLGKSINKYRRAKIMSLSQICPY